MKPRAPFTPLVKLPSLALLLVLIVAPFTARGQTADDPLSGVWTGYIGESPATPMAVRIELKLAPNGALSGSVTGSRITPGEIQSGTFDRATGTLRFTVLLRSTMNERGGAVNFAGRVVQDTASGTLTLGGETGVFQVVKEKAGAGTSSRSKPADAGTAAVRRGFVQAGDWITRAADLVPAERYAWRPVATVRTFGEVVGHIVDGARYYCGRAAGRPLEWSDTTEKTVTTKAALSRSLRQAIAECMAAYDGAGEIGPLTENLAHASLHYGNLVTYLRMMGLVPPSS